MLHTVILCAQLFTTLLVGAGAIFAVLQIYMISAQGAPNAASRTAQARSAGQTAVAAVAERARRENLVKVT